MASSKSITLRQLCIIGIILVIASLINEANSTFSTRKRLCGKALITTLEFICAKSGYNGMSKKDVDGEYLINIYVL